MTESPSEIIDALGGTVAVAELFEIAPPSVSEWRHRGIPRARLMFLRLAHPELFPQPAQPAQPERKEAA